jgi:iron complex outermembrane receptor protein
VTPRTPAAYTAASQAANFHPRLPRYGRLTHDQDRLGITTSVQWKPRDGTLLTWTCCTPSSTPHARKTSCRPCPSAAPPLSQGGKPQTSVLETQYADNGALLYGRYNGVDMRAESRFDELRTNSRSPR